MQPWSGAEQGESLAEVTCGRHVRVGPGVRFLRVPTGLSGVIRSEVFPEWMMASSRAWLADAQGVPPERSPAKQVSIGERMPGMQADQPPVVRDAPAWAAFAKVSVWLGFFSDKARTLREIRRVRASAIDGAQGGTRTHTTLEVGGF